MIMLHVNKDIIPDIYKPRITVISARKYERKPIAIMINVSVTAETVKNLICLNIKAVLMPKKAPINTETMARDKN